jgi:hypothetical protein
LAEPVVAVLGVFDCVESSTHPGYRRALHASPPFLFGALVAALTLVVLHAAAPHGQQEGFRFQGYFRSGFGVAATGDPQEAFRAFGAGVQIEDLVVRRPRRPTSS